MTPLILFMKIEVVRGDITKMEVEAIVNPANSHITMGGGLAGVIRRKGGEEIREEAQKFTPVEVGRAVLTKAGKLPCRFVIHAPTMERPAQKTTKEKVRLATKGILECAEKNGINEVAVPGLGTGVGGVPPKDAAKVMVEKIKNFPAKNVKKIILVGYSEELYHAFKEAITNDF